MATLAYTPPSPCNLGQSKIYELGELIARQIGYVPGSSLEPVVKSLGGTIRYQSLFDLDSSSSGSIEVEGEGQFTIYLANHTSESRDRFTVGHELGHYVLHYLYPRRNGGAIEKMRAERYGTGPVEYEANWFSAAFLMPMQAFRNSFEAHKGNCNLVALEFGVSSQAAEVRAKALLLRQ